MGNTPTQNEPAVAAVQPTAVPAAKKSNKTLLIVVIIIVACLCLSAISAIVALVLPGLALIPFFSTVTPTTNNNSVDTVQEDNSDQPTDSSSTDETRPSDDIWAEDNYTLGELPTNFPTDIPVYGSEDLASSQSNGTTAVVYSTSKTPENVYDSYLWDLATQGWTIGNKGNYGTIVTVEATKGTRKVVMSALGGDSENTVVTLEYTID